MCVLFAVESSSPVAGRGGNLTGSFYKIWRVRRLREGGVTTVPSHVRLPPLRDRRELIAVWSLHCQCENAGSRERQGDCGASARTQRAENGVVHAMHSSATGFVCNVSLSTQPERREVHAMPLPATTLWQQFFCKWIMGARGATGLRSVCKLADGDVRHLPPGRGQV